MHAQCGTTETNKERSNDVKKIQQKYLERRVLTKNHTRKMSPLAGLNSRGLALDVEQAEYDLEPLQISSARVVQ